MGITDKLKFGRVRAQDVKTTDEMPFSHQMLLHTACNNPAVLADIESQHPRVAQGLVAEILNAQEYGADPEIIELPWEWQLPGTTGYIIHNRNCTSSECPVQDGKIDLSDLRQAMKDAEPVNMVSTLEVMRELIERSDDLTIDELSELVDAAYALIQPMQDQLARIKAQDATTATQTAGERTEAPKAPVVPDHSNNTAEAQPRGAYPIKMQSATTREVRTTIDHVPQPLLCKCHCVCGDIATWVYEPEIHTGALPAMTGFCDKHGPTSLPEEWAEAPFLTDPVVSFNDGAEQEAKDNWQRTPEEAFVSPIDLPVSMADADELPAGCTQRDADHKTGDVTCDACRQRLWTEVCAKLGTLPLAGITQHNLEKLVELTNKMLHAAASEIVLPGKRLTFAHIGDIPKEDDGAEREPAEADALLKPSGYDTGIKPF